MNLKELKSFPGEKKGIIQIFFSNSDCEESFQLRLELDLEEDSSQS